jgi:hypothetical protein
MTTFTNDTIMAIILADLDRTCCLCEKTYDARKMDEKFRHHEYCPECMAAEFGHDWADPMATDLNKYGKEGKDCHDSSGMGTGTGSGTHQAADDDGSTCCSDDEPDNRDDDTEDEDEPYKCEACGYVGDNVIVHDWGCVALCWTCSNEGGEPHCPRSSRSGEAEQCEYCVAEWKELDGGH